MSRVIYKRATNPTLEAITKIIVDSRPESNRFSVVLPQSLTVKVRSAFGTNINVFFKGLVQAYFDGRIDKTKVIYMEKKDMKSRTAS